MKKNGLLIVDLQIGFAPKAELIARIEEIVKEYSVVVMTRFTNPPQSLYRSVLDWHGDGGDLALQVPHAVILDKSGYGLSFEHLETLRGLHCVEWHICGLETDACVLASAFSLWDANLRPVIRAELCDSPLHDAGVAIAARQFGAYTFPR